MAKMNFRILKKIETELEYEEKEGEALNTSAAMDINGKQIRRKYKNRYSNLLSLKEILERAINQENDLLLYGEIGVCKADYYKFMHLMFDVDTDLPIPKNLFVYGIIPRYNIPTPPIASDNKSVDQIEFEYQMYYAKYGIVPEYDNGVRKPYPHEMFDWNAEGAIESSYGKANNFYYKKRYLTEMKKATVKDHINNVGGHIKDTVKEAFEDVGNDINTTAKNIANKINGDDKNEQEPKKRKRFSILKRCQATKEELNKIKESVSKEGLPIDKKKKLKRVLIGYGIAIGVVFIAFNATVVIPALVSNPEIMLYAPIYMLKKMVPIFIKLGIPLAVLIVIINVLIKAKKNGNSEEIEVDLSNENTSDITSNVVLDRLMQKIIDNEKRLAATDAKLKELDVKRDVDRIRELQEQRDELIEFKHQILDEMASMTRVPGESGGMTR